jgi:hypothetical protein
MPPRKKNILESTVEATPEVVTTPQQPKAKREKKASKHKVVAIITPDGIQGSFQPEKQRPLIAHLPIKTTDIQFHDQHIAYDPKPPGNPEAYDAAEIDPFSTEAMYHVVPNVSSPVELNRETTSELVETPAPVQTAIPVSTAQQKREYGPTTLLVQFKSSNSTRELPASSTAACFWCCETFEGRPCVIPSYISDSTWHVYGNYCTPQCSLAYLLSESIDTHTRWERIALLNRLYADSFEGRIYPAPSRESLQRFGGPVTAEEYRTMSIQQRVRVDIQLPPMVSILASMDTKPIDFYETTLRNTVVNPYQQLLAKQNDEPVSLKLKRTKPLKDKESTLDACLNIKVR